MQRRRVAADRMPSWFFSSRRSSRIPDSELEPRRCLPMLLFPQIPQGLLPMVVKEGENLLQMRVVHRADIVLSCCSPSCAWVALCEWSKRSTSAAGEYCVSCGQNLHLHFPAQVIACFSSTDKLLGFLRGSNARSITSWRLTAHA